MQRTKVEKKLLKLFADDDIDGVRIRGGGTAVVQRARFPNIADKKAFDKYVLKHKAFDLYQRRVAAKAYFDRLESGESVPGVAIFERTRISIRGKGD